jgi:hypothetical protein
MDPVRAQAPLFVARGFDPGAITLATALVAACAPGPSRSPELPSISPATLAGHWKLTEMVAPSGRALRIEGAIQELQIDGDSAIWISGNDVCHGITSGIPVRRVDGGGLVLAVSAGIRRCGPAPCASRYRALPMDGAPAVPWEGRGVDCPTEDGLPHSTPDYQVVKATDRAIELRGDGPWMLRFER